MLSRGEQRSDIVFTGSVWLLGGEQFEGRKGRTECLGGYRRDPEPGLDQVTAVQMGGSGWTSDIFEGKSK